MKTIMSVFLITLCTGAFAAGIQSNASIGHKSEIAQGSDEEPKIKKKVISKSYKAKIATKMKEERAAKPKK